MHANAITMNEGNDMDLNSILTGGGIVALAGVVRAWLKSRPARRKASEDVLIDRIGHLEGRIESLEKIISGQLERIAAKTVENGELRTEIVVLNRSIAQMSRELEEEKQFSSQLEAELKAREAEIKALKEGSK